MKPDARYKQPEQRNTRKYGSCADRDGEKMFDYQSLTEIWADTSFMEKLLLVGGFGLLAALIVLCLYYLIRRIDW